MKVGSLLFQLNITDKIIVGDNLLVVEVSNERTSDAIPALHYDWWNYGGITHDVMLISTPKTFIENYFIQLDKEQADIIHAEIQLSEKKAGEKIAIEIPELHLKEKTSLLTLPAEQNFNQSKKIDSLVSRRT